VVVVEEQLGVVPLLVVEVEEAVVVEGLVVESSLVAQLAVEVVLPLLLCYNYNCNCMVDQEDNCHPPRSLIEILLLLVA